MNRLTTAKRVQVVAAVVEGTSINAIVRMTGVAKHTVLKLLEDMGCACAAYHYRNVRGLRVRHLQCDETLALFYSNCTTTRLREFPRGRIQRISCRHFAYFRCYR